MNEGLAVSLAWWLSQMPGEGMLSAAPLSERWLWHDGVKNDGDELLKNAPSFWRRQAAWALAERGEISGPSMRGSSKRTIRR